MMVLSGVLCLILQKDWFVGINYRFKIPFYATLGMSFAFIVIFIAADCLNYCSLVCTRLYSRPLIERPCQVYVLTFTAILMGLSYGLMFGFLDVEDANMYRLALVALKEESVCYPIGLVLGFVQGFFNEFMRERNNELRVVISQDKVVDYL